MHVLLLTAKGKAEKLSSYIATYGCESVNLQELWLKLHIFRLEKSPVMFVLSIKTFLESVGGSGCKDAKTGEQSVFSEIHTIHRFEMP